MSTGPGGKKALGVDLAKSLAGLTALAAGITALGKTTGILDQMQRDHTVLSSIAFGLAILAGFAIAGGGLFEKTDEQRWWFGGALVLFLAAIGLALAVITTGRGDRPTPNIEVTLKAGAKGAPWSLAGAVTAERMTSSQTLQVAVLVGEERIYQARIGGDTNGAVKLPFALPVDAAKRELPLKVVAWIDEPPQYCLTANLATAITGTPTKGKKAKEPGCVVLRVPAAASG